MLKRKVLKRKVSRSLAEEDTVQKSTPQPKRPWPRPTLGQKLASLRGSSIEHDLRPYASILDEISAAGQELEGLADHTLKKRAAALLATARDGQDDTILDTLLVQTYALARESARRVVGLHPYDVQVMAAIALHDGKVVEMQTGEGKTLAAVMPACLHALTGRGAHVLTFNDYLARRDAEWMGPIYRFLGLRVAWVKEGMTPAERRAAYQADITYLTAKEAGFDLLRDQRCTAPQDLVHRPFSFALVDEADSLLIDEARVPLVLAGTAEHGSSSAPRLAELVRRLEPEVHYELEAQGRNVELTETGFDFVEARLGNRSLLAEESYSLLTELNCALHAQVLLRRDVDYLVREGRIELIDEFTGRVVEDRHWPDGLQAALEAKEGLEHRTDGRILGSMTLQHLLSSYPKLCGMTGTAQDAARELAEVYDLDVVVIPTHRPAIRLDHPDRVFTHREAKENAIVDEIRHTYATGRPVLVGTASVAESERLAERMADAGIPCAVMNAKNDALEASIVAQAGKLGAVTIATNMAGRGTDIRLGGEDESERPRLIELGGLYVIGTELHESRRVDLQLRGRAGRQGDPGESRFFVSLDDELCERFGARRLIPPRFLPERRAEPLDHPLIRRELARAQRRVEGQNLEIRRMLWRYAKPVEEQSRMLQEERRALLFGASPILWREEAPDPHAELIAAVGEKAVRRAEVMTTLFHIDRAWSEHLALIASLREGIHLVGLGGEDPLTSFQVRTAEAFHRMLQDIDEAVIASLDAIAVRGGELDLEALDLEGPAATWTYLINDDPFRQQLARLLTGPGQSTLAIGAALVAGPFFFLWLLVERLFRRRSRRGGGR